ncbi:hypothetical protein IKE13_00670 [Candidatus Saccharibacteria bacterium]|nr:hypothetical protein [Candidatus Saccharibacteria bacterium]
MEYKKNYSLNKRSFLTLFLRTIKPVLMIVFWGAMALNSEFALATIDPNSYYVNASMQNINQGVEVSNSDASEKYLNVKRTINVNTNAPSGYRMYVNIPSDEESAGNLVLLGGDSLSPSVSKLTTTPATASVLGVNTWGFGIPNTTSGLPTNNFSSSYSPSNPSAGNTYSGVVISPGYTLIRNVVGAVSGDDSFDIYYGLRLGSDVLSTPGTYQTSISYHTLIDATDVVGGEATIAPTSGPKSGYENVTVTTSLMTDFVPNGITVTIGGQECTNPRGNVSTGVLRIACITQAHVPGAEDVVVNIGSLGISYMIEDGYEYLETGDVKITNVSYVSGTNVNGTPRPTVDENNNVDFDLTFKSGITDNDNTFTATYRFTMANTTSSDYIFTAPVSNLTLRLSSTTTSEVYYELDGISVGDTIPANSTISYNVILSADYASGTHGVEGGMEVEPVEDRTGSLVGSIYGSNQGDLSGDNELAMFQLSVQNTFTSAKTFTIDVMGNDFIVTNSTGGFLDAQTIPASTTATYTFYVKKANGATYGSDFVNAAIVLSYDGVETNSGTLKIAVDIDPSFVDSEAPYISGVSVVRNDTIGSATVSWSGTDNVGVASYAIYPCVKNDESYSCGSPVTGISGEATSYTLTGLSDGLYGVVVVGFDDEGNTATQEEIDSATTDSGHASRSEDTEIRWTFNIVGKITNGRLSNNGDTIQMGGSYSGTVSANSGYNTPGSVTVKMNGRDLTSSQYSYSNGTVRITIPVDGDIEITANCPWNWCLIEGTLVALADGSSIPIDQVTYDTLLKVWNYETGSVGAEYPAWIEKEATTISYQLTKFDDGSELKTAGWHGVFDVDRNAFISIDDEEFGVGSRIYKVNENDELEAITVTSIEMITEEVHYYHVVSSQYYNIIANNIITTDGAVYLSNLYGFDENIKWPAIRDEVMSDPDNLYTYEDFEDIGMPRKMFDDLRVQEAKYLAVTYGITLDVFKGYLLSNQLNTDIWLNYCEGSVKLREEYCPAEPEETIQGNVTESNTQGKAQTSSVENEIENSDEFDTEDGYEEPLGETTRAGDVNESTTGGLTIEGVLVESLVIAGAIGSFYLATRDRSRDKKK